METNRKMDPDVPEESKLLPADSKTERFEWHYRITLVKQLDRKGEGLTDLASLKKPWRSSKFGNLKACLQSLFKDMSHPDPKGMVGFFTKNRICLIEVFGPLGEKDPIYRFEVKNSDVWEVRDPDTKRTVDISELVADNYTFSEGKDERRRKRRTKLQMQEHRRSVGALMIEGAAIAAEEPGLIEAIADIAIAFFENGAEVATGCVETGIELACSVLDAGS